MSVYVRSCYEEGCKLERELTAVTAQRDEAREALAAEIKHHIETTAKWNGHHMDLTITQFDLNKALRERDEAREQRDRLAEALEKVSRSWNYVEVAREALQSLTPNANCPDAGDKRKADE